MRDAVVVIGAGLIGASIGQALVKAGFDVHLEDKVASHAVVAAGRGAGTPDAADPASVGLVVVAIPPDGIAKVVATSLTRFPNATVTDVGSVKAAVVAGVAGRVADMSRYVGSHPMAGSQHTGPLTAVPELFVDRTWVITPHDTSSDAAITRVEELATLCGARIIRMDAEAHDQAVAEVSHVPQLMSSLTAGHLRGVPADHLQLAGQGIRDVTRIAGSDPVLWRQIVSANREAIRTALQEIRDDLDQLLIGLDEPKAVEAFIARGRTGARSLAGKHGGRRREFVAVVVEIPDAPGALARLFVDIEKAGVNVEDVSIEHDPLREVGWLSVDVDPRRADTLRAAMLDNGWALRA